MNSAEGLALVARVVGGLVIVLVLVAISAKIARRTRHFGGGTDLEIIDRLGISRDTQLAVVRVAGRHLLLGIGPQGVSMLSHLDDPSMAFEPGAPVVVQEPPVTPAPAPALAPVTISDLPEDIAADLVAEFEAAARAETAQAELARAEAAQAEAHAAGTHAAVADDSSEQPLRRPRRRHAAPGEPDGAPVAGTTPADVADVAEIPEVQLPGALNLGDYPDLASALRAAGRTTHQTGQPTTQTGQPSTDAEADQPGSSSWIPAQRPGSQGTDLSHATSSAPVAPGAAEPETEAGGRRRGKVRRVPQQRPAQANGSVLSPSTWRQGIDALREMTVRRG